MLVSQIAKMDPGLRRDDEQKQAIQR